MARGNKLLFLLFLVFLVGIPVFLSGCAPQIHPLEKAGTLQLQTVAPIQVRAGGKYVKVDCRDGTGNNMNLQDAVTSCLRQRGKAVVSDVKNSDYILNGQVSSLSYQRDTSRPSGGGAIIGALVGAALAGGFTGGFTGDPWLAMAAAGGGALAGGAIGHQADQQMAPGIVTAKVFVRVEERINFLGEKQADLPEPVQKYRKIGKTLKSGKRVWVREKIIEMEEAETPVKSTVASAQSGAGTMSTVIDRRVAKFVPHQAEFDVTLVVEHNAPVPEIIQRLEEKIASAIANTI